MSTHKRRKLARRAERTEPQRAEPLPARTVTANKPQPARGPFGLLGARIVAPPRTVQEMRCRSFFSR